MKKLCKISAYPLLLVICSCSPSAVTPNSAADSPWSTSTSVTAPGQHLPNIRGRLSRDSSDDLKTFQHLTRVQILDVQKKLQTKVPFADLKPSGAWDTSTIAAMQTFQAQEGLPRSNYPNRATLEALGISLVTQ